MISLLLLSGDLSVRLLRAGSVTDAGVGFRTASAAIGSSSKVSTPDSTSPPEVPASSISGLRP